MPYATALRKTRAVLVLVWAATWVGLWLVPLSGENPSGGIAVTAHLWRGSLSAVLGIVCWLLVAAAVSAGLVPNDLLVSRRARHSWGYALAISVLGCVGVVLCAMAQVRESVHLIWVGILLSGVSALPVLAMRSQRALEWASILVGGTGLIVLWFRG